MPASGRPQRAPRAAVRRLEGRRVVVRAFRPEEADILWREHQALDATISREGPGPPDRVRAAVGRSGRFWRGRLDLAVDVDDRLIGQIQVRAHPMQTLPPDVFEVGVALWLLSDRRRGYGSEAVALVTSWLFEHAGAARVQATTDPGNDAMRVVLEKLGFELEGILRDFFPTATGRDDMAMYAVTADRWILPVGLRSLRPP